MTSDGLKTGQEQADSRLEALRLELMVLQSEIAAGSLTFPEALQELVMIARSYRDAYCLLQKASDNVEEI